MDDFGEFLGQIPPIIPVLFCGFMLLLLISAGVMVGNNRSRRNTASSAERRREKADWLASAGSESGAEMPPLMNASDLPDLDLLVGSAPIEAASPPSPVASRQRGTHWLTLADGSSVEAADVLVIARDLADGSLIVQLGSKAYPLGAYIDDADARRRFTGTLRDLLSQGEAMTAAPPVAVPLPPEPEPIVEPVVEEAAPEIELPVEVVESVEIPSEPEPEAEPTSTETQPQPAPKASPSSTATVQQTPSGALPGDLPKFVMEDAPLKMRGGMPKNPVPEINIGGAVEAYLQYKLSQSPEFAKRIIHIHPAYGGGIKIEVDGRFYEAVDEIEDDATRDFIMDAIQEWQSRQ